MKLRRTKQSVPVFWTTLYTPNAISWLTKHKTQSYTINQSWTR